MSLRVLRPIGNSAHDVEVCSDSGVSSSGSCGTSIVSSRGRGRGRRGVPIVASEPRPGIQAVEKPSPICPDKEEDELVQKAKALGLIDQQNVMSRPAYGKVGQLVPLYANYYPLRIGGDTGATLIVQRYQVEFLNTAIKLDRDDKRYLFWECVRRHGAVFGNKFGVAFDDSAACYSLGQLKFPGGGHKFVFEFQHKLELDNKPFTYQLQFQYTGAHVVDMKQVANPNHKDRPMDPVQILDIVINQGKRCPLNGDAIQKWYPHGRGVYRLPNGNSGGLDLGLGRQLWTGYQAAGKVGEGWKPMLNVDVSNTAFYKKQSFLEYACDMLEDRFASKPAAGGRGGGRGGYNAPPQPRTFHVSGLRPDTMFQAEWIRHFNDSIRRCGPLKLKTTHMREQRSFRFQTIISQSAAEMKFKSADGVETSVAEYFVDKYGPLRFPLLPLVQVKPAKKNIFLPMECLDILSPQKFPSKKLTDLQVASMIRASARPPLERKRIIDQLVRDLDPTTDPFLREFGVSLGLEMVELQGRVLPPQRMAYARGASTALNGVWDQAGPFLKPAVCHSYSLISFARQSFQDKLESFCVNLTKTCNMAGLQIPTYPQCVEYVQSAYDIERAMLSIKKNSEANGQRPDIVLIVMTAKDANAYAEVKRWGDIELGVMTQCILWKNAQKIAETAPGQRAATANNVALKLNVKLGGVNTAVVDTVWERIKDNTDTLFLGVDVTHPGAHDIRSPSIGCVVGNVNRAATRWGASIKIQRHRREHMVYMQEEAKSRIMNYFKESKVKPSRIVVFRDGVSEGQFMEVLREEMMGIRAACLSLESTYKPPITFIVVQKRHHTRLFLKNGERNITPGTVVDRCITHPVEFDYFLCSHAGIQGTSRPTHYHVLHDDNNWATDELQMMTYQLCHLFARCNRVVSIPAPVYFADLCCTRARSHVRSKMGLLASDDTSTRSGRSSDEGYDDQESSVSDRDLKQSVQVHSNFINQMYFI